MTPPEASQPQPPPRQLPDRRQQRQQQQQQQWAICPEQRQPPPTPMLSPPQQQWWEQADERGLPCLQAAPPQDDPAATPPAAPGTQHVEASGCGQLTTTSQATLSLPLQPNGDLSWPQSLQPAASLGSLFLPGGSWPPLDCGSLVPPAIPEADVPLHQAHNDLCYTLPALEPLQQAGQQTWAAPLQAASQWSSAGHRAAPPSGGLRAEDGACSQPAGEGGWDACMHAAACLNGEGEQMPDVLDLALELGLLPLSRPASPAASLPSWVPSLAGGASPAPAHPQHSGGECPNSAGNELLALFSEFDLPLAGAQPQQGGLDALLGLPQPVQVLPVMQPVLPRLLPADAEVPQLWEPQQLPAAAAAGAPEAAPPMLLTPACVQPPRQRQQHGTAKRQAGNLGPRQQRQQQLKRKRGHGPLTKRHLPAAGRRRQPSRCGCAAAQATLRRPCTRSAARAASIAGGAGAAPIAPQPRPQPQPQPQPHLKAKASQAMVDALLAALRSRAAAKQAEEAAARHQQQREVLEGVPAEQQRQLEMAHCWQQAQVLELEMAQQAQVLQLEQSPLGWQPKPAPQWPPAGLLASRQPQPAAAAQRLLPVDRQPLLPQLPPLQRVISAPVQRLPRPQLPPLQRTSSAPLRRVAAQLLEPSLVQCTLSLRLRQQEERLARQRAEQQQWADAAALLLSRGGRQ